MIAPTRRLPALLISLALPWMLEPAAPAKFEVASIKPLDPNVPHQVGTKIFPGGRIAISGVSLRGLIAIAFQLSYWQISGGDPWTEKDEFVIDALPPKDTSGTVRDLRYTLFTIEDPNLRHMLQSLLADRFQLKFHRGTKPGEVYFLERSSKKLRLNPIPETERSQAFGSIGYAGAKWTISRSTLPQLAKFAADNILHAPVTDRTGLTGLFTYRQPEPDLDPNYTDNSSSFLNMLSEVGLKLKHSKGKIDTFIIDRAERPSPN